MISDEESEPRKIKTELSDGVTIRRFSPVDYSQVVSLWPAGRMDLATSSDESEVLAKTLTQMIPGRHDVWVAEAAGHVIGSVVAIHQSNELAHFRFMCVNEHWHDRDAVAMSLGDVAVRNAWDRGYLKIIIHTRRPVDRVTALMHHLGFEFSREHAIAGDHVLEYFLDLYSTPQPAKGSNGTFNS